MAASNFQTVVAEVKSAYSVEDYIANDGVVLKQSGPYKLKGLCPFPGHNEKTPSFTVDTQFQNYYCFGCKESGDLISYIQATQNLSFWESLKMLADPKGIEIEDQEAGPRVDYTSLKAILKHTAQFYVAHFQKLSEDHAAKREIEDRGLDLTVMRFGYAPERRGSLYSFLTKKGYSNELIEQSGVCRESKTGSFYDFWNGRLMFVIADIQGNPIGFSGRKLFDTDKRGKYVNSTDSPLFNKSRALFNVSKAKKSAGVAKEIFVVEGQFDVAAFVAADIQNVVAASGTSFTTEHGQTCSRLVGGSAGKVIFSFDGDEAGRKAATRVFETCPELHPIAYAVPFDDGDPCDYRKQNGDDGLREKTSSDQIPLVDFVLNNLEVTSDLKSTTGRAKYVREAARLLSVVKSQPILDSAIRRVALHSVSSHDSVIDEVKSARKSTQTRKPRVNDDSEDQEVVEVEPTPEEINEEEILGNIASDEHYRTSAKYIALTVRFSKLRPALVSSKELLPAELAAFADDIEAAIDTEGGSGAQARLIPEAFTHPEIAKVLFSQDFMPHLSVMTGREVVSLYKRLKQRLAEIQREQTDEDLRGRITQILGAGTGGSVKDLKRALALEEKMRNEAR